MSPAGCNPYCQYVLGGPSLLGAVGTGVGVRASFRRFSVEMMIWDVYNGFSSRSQPSDGALALTYRLGSAGDR